MIFSTTIPKNNKLQYVLYVELKNILNLVHTMTK